MIFKEKNIYILVINIEHRVAIKLILSISFKNDLVIIIEFRVRNIALNAIWPYFWVRGALFQTKNFPHFGEN